MKQQIDVIAIFDIGATAPRPLRFQILEDGVKSVVKVESIDLVQTVGAGFASRVEFSCKSTVRGRKIAYKLLYYYQDCKWEVEL